MSKKLKHITLLGLASIMFLIPTNQVYAAQTYYQNDKNIVNEYSDYGDVVNIKNCIGTYFDGEFKSIMDGKAVNQDNIICNQKLKQLTSLKNERKAIWYKALDDVILDYKINIDYESIDLENNTCIINLSKDTTFSFTKSPDMISKEFDNKHTVTLKKINNKWLIDNDVDLSEAKENSQVQNTSNQSDITKKVQTHMELKMKKMTFQ